MQPITILILPGWHDSGPHGHINADAGFGEWPVGEQLLQQLAE